MADVRALLKAKRQEARVTHPYASYSAAGQLRCTVCGTAVKQASMWEGHLGSKVHRVNVMKMREEEARRREKLDEVVVSPVQGKRKADGLNENDEKKRRLSDDEHESEPGLSQPKANGHSIGGFPADFFSDPSRAPDLVTEEEDEEKADNAAPSATTKTEFDLEWERFQATVVNAQADEKEEDRREAYSRATVAAEPELVDQDMEGIPPQVGEDASEPQEQKEETEEELRKRKEQEEKELIMDRLLEEERVQEEADSRVGLLKARVEALKRARELRKASGKKG